MSIRLHLAPVRFCFLAAALVTLAAGMSGCCASLHCRAARMAKAEINCEQKAIEVKVITQRVCALGRCLGEDAPQAGRNGEFVEAKGCGRKTYLECKPRSASAPMAIPGPDRSGGQRTISEPSWRCWTIPDPFSLPPANKSPKE